MTALVAELGNKQREPLTVRIKDGRLLVCARTNEQLAAGLAGSPIDLSGIYTVPVWQRNGTSGRWAGVPLGGMLAFMQWACAASPDVDLAFGALLELVVEAMGVVARGELVVDLDDDGDRCWRPAPGRTSAQRIDALYARAHDAVDTGETIVVLADWFANTVSELADATLALPELTIGRQTRRLRTWARQIAARAGTSAALCFQLVEPYDDDNSTQEFLLRGRLESFENNTIALLEDSGAASRLGCSPQRIEDLINAEWEAAHRAFTLLGAEPAGEFYLSVSDVAELLEHGVTALAGVGISVLLPASMVKPTKLVRRAVVAGTTAGLDAATLALTGEVLVDGQSLTRADAEKLAAAHSDLVSIQGKWLRVGEEERVAALAFLERLEKGKGASAAEVIDMAAELDELDSSQLEGWVARVLAGEFAVTAAERIDRVDGITGELRHYQLDGVSWLTWLEENNLGGILADSMGLGKTLVVLARIAYEHSVSTPGAPTLVVAPTSVTGNWLREVAKFAPNLKVVLHHGSARLDAKSYLGKADIVVTSYGVMRRDEGLADIDWHRVVLDEAQMIKNPTTVTARAARKLKATHHLAVTGTPVENHLGELWSLMAFAGPGLLGTQRQFAQRYDKTNGERADALANLRKRIGPFILRRHKSDPGIADELPERIIERQDCELTGEQAGLYQAVAKQMMADVSGKTGIKRHGQVLAGITKLKQICNHPATVLDGAKAVKLDGRSGKLERLVELVDEIVDSGEAVVIFSQYATFLRRIADHLREKLSIEVENLDGKMGRVARERAVDRFSAAGGPPVICVSLKAGGTGLNLVRANHVIHFDRWWNPAVEEQASDRVWRIGQTRGVVVHTLVCPGTLEERIADLLDSKRDLADEVITSSPETLISNLDDAAMAAFVELDDMGEVIGAEGGTHE